MSFFDQEFNVADLPVSTSQFDPLPEGWYNVTIAGAELKTTKAGTGNYISIKYTVIGPSHQGRVVFGNLNVKNPNPKAEEIGRQQLGAMMRAIGLSKIKDTDQLIGGNLSIKLTVKPADGQYDASNDIKGFKSIVGASLPVPNVMQSVPFNAAPAQAATPSAAPPWAKK
jgi:hypothetical protein